MFSSDSSEDQETDGNGKKKGTTSVHAAPESLTPIQCELHSEPCKNKVECVYHTHICDGEVDCTDGSDEEDCTLTCEAGETLLRKAHSGVIFRNDAL